VDALPPDGGDEDLAGSAGTGPLGPFEQRLAQAEDPSEIVLWTQIRGELMRQNEEALDRQATRRRQAEIVRFEFAQTLLAVAVGVFLVQEGAWLLGMLCLGVGFYRLAPGYVRQFTPWRQSRESDNDEE